MKILLDTTYFLPAIGISVKGLPADVAIRLMKNGHQVFIGNISIFELSAKGSKHVAARTLSAERVARGIRAIVHGEGMTVIPIHESALLLAAFRLRNLLGDFIDCLILSSAINHCDILVTEDDDIRNLEKSREFTELLARTNPGFRIQTSAEPL